jgi:hypothetical protein
MALEDADFSDDFCQFLQDSVPAVEAAELLLLLRRESGRSWMAADAVSALGPSVSLEREAAARYFDDFEARGLVTREGAQGVKYRPASETLENYVSTLEKVYRERPVTLIRVIYGLRDSKIRSFAEAFKLRRK